MTLPTLSPEERACEEAVHRQQVCDLKKGGLRRCAAVRKAERAAGPLVRLAGMAGIDHGNGLKQAKNRDLDEDALLVATAVGRATS